MKKQILLLVTLLVMLGTHLVYGQFQNGIFSSSNSGVLGVTINPANSNLLSNGTDFMPFFFTTSVLNNDFYLPPKPITSVLKPEIFTAFQENETLGGETINQKFDRLFDLQRSLKPKGYIFADFTIYGPSFLTNIGRHSFGIQTSFKAAESTVNLPKELATFLQKGLSTTELVHKTFSLNKVQAATIAYRDIAFNYSYNIYESYTSMQRLGITLQYLSGVNSMIFQDNGGTTWDVGSDSSLVMYRGDFQYNYAAVNSKDFGTLMQKRGTGFGVDLGYIYVRKKTSRPTRTTYCPNIRGGGKVREYQTFKWKLGVAVMDIGSIYFDKETVANHYTNALGRLKDLDAEFYKGVFALNRAFAAGLIQIGTKNDLKTSYVHYLPTRVNLQFDYFYKNYWYFSLALSQRTPLSNNVTMLAPNIVSLQARYEKLRYEIGVPISLVEYQYPVLGLNFRYGPFVIGSNQILEMVGLRKIFGVDMYLGLKFNISNIGMKGI
ncbi:MAG: DUF5723 family protein [Bacteroidota bacterium]|nr:DUF5723 family protein [Bacteroidota bacterium]